MCVPHAAFVSRLAIDVKIFAANGNFRLPFWRGGFEGSRRGEAHRLRVSRRVFGDDADVVEMSQHLFRLRLVAQRVNFQSDVAVGIFVMR